MVNLTLSAAAVLTLVGPGAPGPVLIENAFPNLTFQFPVDIKDPMDGTNRLFVVEKLARIVYFDNDPSANTKTTFLDLTGATAVGEEGGIVALAFHPDFENNGHFFISYSKTGPLRSIVSRFTTVGGDHLNLADPASEVILFEIPQILQNHNTHRLEFGPEDGYLYISAGDGACCGDPGDVAQDLTDLRGSLLRIDIDTTAPGLDYGIPKDNPFAGNTDGYREEIYAYGLRNPWRFSFDSTGRIWLGDVGQNLWEEVDWIVKGGNYGWPIMEGFHCFDPPAGCDTTGLEMPIWEFFQATDGAIIGGYVYETGTSCRALCGKYICADFVNENIFALSFDETGLTGAETIIPNSGAKVSGFGIDRNGELLGTAYSVLGSVFKITCTGGGADLNCDGVVGFADLSQLLANWGPCGDCDDCLEDIDGDCMVGFADLTAVLNAWG